MSTQPQMHPVLTPLFVTAMSGLLALVLAASCGPSSGPTDAGVDSAPVDAGPLPGSELPAQWSVRAPGISVDVTREPYGYVVRNAAGDDVVHTAGRGGPGEGYSSLAWTTGTTRWRANAVSRGYSIFSAALDPWRDEWIVVAARESEGGLELTLQHGRDAAQRMIVNHRVFDTSLRVEARVTGGEARAWEAAFATPADEAFLGFGERFNRTNQRGVDVYNWAEEGGIGAGEGTIAGPDNPRPNGQAMSYYPVPFFLSSRGYAFWLDTTWRSEFNLATQHADAWRAWHIGPSLAYEIYLPRADDARPWPYQLIDRFTQTTGRPMIPPAWTFGPRRRVGSGSMQHGVSEVQAMRDLDIAVTAVDDAVHFLPAGSHVGRETALSAWTTDARRLGYRVCGYYNSLLSAAPDNPIRRDVDRAVANRWVLRRSDGTPSPVFLISGSPVTVYQIDFSSRDATRWFQSALTWALDLGYSGWMYDFGEYVQADVLTASGLTGEEFHNLYPVLYQRAAFEALESGPMRGDWLTFARSGYTGASQYTPMIWSGDPAASFEDSDGLPSMVRGGVNMGISGVPHWGGDIGGFHCPVDGFRAADAELVTRWVEQGSMSSNMQDQNACSGALDTGPKASMWNSMDVQRAWFEYGRLHTRLFPYLYTLAYEAHATGAPVTRHLFLEHPDHAELAGADDTYYLGPALLVAPVVHRGERARAVNFPPGRFLDWHDASVHAGGTTAMINAPLERLPLFLRDGYLVPLLDPTIDTLSDETSIDVVGPSDVASVYDVVGFLSSRATPAVFTLWDGTRLQATWQGAFAAPASLPLATSAMDLATCAGCYLRDVVSPGLSRVRISTSDPSNTAGGLRLASTVTRRIRWDLYLAE